MKWWLRSGGLVFRVVSTSLLVWELENRNSLRFSPAN